MPIYAVFHPQSGQIQRVKSTPEEYLRIETDTPPAEIANRMMVQDGALVERPKIFDVEHIEVNVGDMVTAKVAPGTLISYDRPDLDLSDRGRVQKFSTAIEGEEFGFQSEATGTFTLKFKNTFPYQEQTIRITVSE